jgi:hypothetical protein
MFVGHFLDESRVARLSQVEGEDVARCDTAKERVITVHEEVTVAHGNIGHNKGEFRLLHNNWLAAIGTEDSAERHWAVGDQVTSMCLRNSNPSSKGHGSIPAVQ